MSGEYSNKDYAIPPRRNPFIGHETHSEIAGRYHIASRVDFDWGSVITTRGFRKTTGMRPDSEMEFLSVPVTDSPLVNIYLVGPDEGDKPTIDKPIPTDHAYYKVHTNGVDVVYNTNLPLRDFDILGVEMLATLVGIDNETLDDVAKELVERVDLVDLSKEEALEEIFKFMAGEIFEEELTKQIEQGLKDWYRSYDFKKAWRSARNFGFIGSSVAFAAPLTERLLMGGITFSSVALGAVAALLSADSASQTLRTYFNQTGPREHRRSYEATQKARNIMEAVYYTDYFRSEYTHVVGDFLRERFERPDDEG